jgi:hypothetical protein
MGRPFGPRGFSWSAVCALALVILFACRATVGPRLPPPPASVEVTFPASDVTMWVQDLVHWDRHVYGLFHHFGDPKLPGLWRVNVDSGEFSMLRLRSGEIECRLPLNDFAIGPAGMEAVFFCPPGCDAYLCSGGEVHDAETVVMPYRGQVEDEWHPTVQRSLSGSIEGWRYIMDTLDPHAEGDSGHFVLLRSEKRVRGRN